jgi:predicted TIM-barrel fold metal-dependent hydrolase
MTDPIRQIIDGHSHIVPPEIVSDRQRHLESDLWFRRLYTNPRRTLATADDVAFEMARSGVDTTVTFGFAWRDPSICVLNNDYILEQAAAHPESLVPFCVVPPANLEFSIVEMERCRRRGAVGVGEIFPEGQGWDLSDRGALTTFISAVRDLGLILNLHVTEPAGHDYPGKDSTTPGAIWPIIEIAQGEVPIVLSHWGAGTAFYELMPEVRDLARQLYYDSAASHLLYRPQVFDIMSRLAPDRIIFGSDFPLMTQRRALRHTRAADLDRQIADGLLGGNAYRLGLRGVPDPA